MVVVVDCWVIDVLLVNDTYRGEERVRLDVFNAVRPRPKSVGWVPLEKSAEKRLGLGTGKGRHLIKQKQIKEPT